MRLFRSTLLVLSAIAATPLLAQYQFGVQAGPQYVSISQTFTEELLEGLDIPAVNGFGAHFGVWYRSDRSRIVQVRVGLNWSYRTFDTDYERMEVDTATSVIYTYEGNLRSRLQYLELPVQASWYFWRGAHVDAGLAPGYLLTARRLDEGETTYLNPDGSTFKPAPYESPVKDVTPFKRAELSICSGLGYDFSNGITAGISYLRTLGQLNDEGERIVAQRYNLVRVAVGYDLLHEKRRRQVYRKHSG